MENKLYYLFKHVDECMPVYKERLAQLISLKTVAEEIENPEVRYDIGRSITTISNFLRDKLCMKVTVVKNRKTYLPGRHPAGRPKDNDSEGNAEGDEQMKKDELPPFILGEYGHDVNKMTLLIYGHLDVTPACKEDGWNFDPFQLEEDDDYFYGRGTSDCKGQFLAWLCGLESFFILNIDIPLNIRIVVEVLEETGSEGLQELIFEQRKLFFKDVDFVVSSDSYWLTDDKPCVSYGARGVNYFFVEVECAKMDLHSGVHGGNINEAMGDLVYLLSSLTYPNGYLKFPHFYENIVRASGEEIKIHENSYFPVNKYKAEVGAYELLHPTKEQLLEHRGVLPCLSIHGIEGSYDKAGGRLVIPHKVIGKFSIRIVPNQEPDEINAIVIKYLTDLHNKRSRNPLKIDAFRSKKAFSNDPLDISHRAAAIALERIWKQEPDHIREGASVPVMRMFQEILEKSVMLLPLSRASCANHIINEKMAKVNFQNGVKTVIAYLFELHNLIAAEMV